MSFKVAASAFEDVHGKSISSSSTKVKVEQMLLTPPYWTWKKERNHTNSLHLLMIDLVDIEVEQGCLKHRFDKQIDCVSILLIGEWFSRV